MESFLSFNFGNALTIFSFIVGGIFLASAIRSDVKSQGARLHNIEQELSELRKVVVSLARQEERMLALDSRMLSQGQRIDALSIRLDHMTDRMNVVSDRA